jgi:hypothetical protein
MQAKWRFVHRFNRIDIALKPLQQGINKRLCCFQVGRVEAFGKTIVDGLKQFERLSGSILTVPQARKTRGRPQLPRQRTLSAGAVKRLPKVILGHRRLAGRSPHHQKVSFAAQELWNYPQFLGALHAFRRLSQRIERVINLSCTSQGLPAHPPMWLTAGRKRTRARRRGAGTDPALACL